MTNLQYHSKGGNVMQIGTNVGRQATRYLPLGLGFCNPRRYYPSAVYTASRCISVRLSQVGVLSEWLNKVSPW